MIGLIGGIGHSGRERPHPSRSTRKRRPLPPIASFGLPSSTSGASFQPMDGSSGPRDLAASGPTISLCLMQPLRIFFYSPASWETSPDGGLCTAIVTEPAAPNLAHIHSRQGGIGCRLPLRWLSQEITERHQVRSVAQRLDPQGLVSWPVTPAMNRPDFDGPEAIEPIKEQ